MRTLVAARSCVAERGGVSLSEDSACLAAAAAVPDMQFAPCVSAALTNADATHTISYRCERSSAAPSSSAHGASGAASACSSLQGIRLHASQRTLQVLINNPPSRLDPNSGCRRLGRRCTR